MVAAFVNDLRFLEDEEGKFYVRGYDRAYWNRYLQYFDKLYVVGRRFKASKEEVKGMELFGDEKLELYEIPSLHSLPMIFKNYHKVNVSIKQLTELVDCIITRQPSTNSNKAIAICKKNNKPYIVELVGCPWDALWNHSWRGKILAPFFFLKTRKNLKEAKFVIYVTKEFLQKRYPTKGQNIGCSDVAFPIADESVLKNRKLRISRYKDNSCIHIVTISDVGIKYKGHQYMIQALAKLKKDGRTNIKYHIVGKGNSKRLKELANQLSVSDQVIFYGSMKHDDIFLFLDKMDIYIQPSDTEGLPRALLEAMSRGLPCLGTDVGGIPELLDKEFLFSKRRSRIDEITCIIKNFSPEVMKEQAERNFNKATEYRSYETDAKRKKIFKAFLKTV